MTVYGKEYSMSLFNTHLGKYPILLSLFIVFQVAITGAREKDHADSYDANQYILAQAIEEHELKNDTGEQKSRTAQWREDLDFMISNLEQIHPNLFAKADETAFRTAVKKLYNDIPNMTDNAIIVGLLGLTAILEDGHTRIHGTNLTDFWFPIRIETLVDGLFVTATSQENGDMIGRQVVEIANRPAEEVFELIKSVTPHDNEYSQTYSAPMYLTMNSILNGLGVIEEPQKLAITFLNDSGEKEQRIIKAHEFSSDQDLSWYWLLNSVPANDGLRFWDGRQQNELPLYLQNLSSPYWYHHLKQENLIYIGFNLCAENPQESFAEFNANLWRLIENEDIQYVVVDLRNNIGGSNSFLQPLLHKLICHPEISKGGNLFVIIGRKSWSAAVHLATWLDYHVDPIFVGEPTGSGPNHFADPELALLPNSKILLLVSHFYWQNSWPWDDRHWIEPGILIQYSSDHYFSLSDPAMDSIRAAISRSKE